jgi:hypothetical protein
MRATSMIVGGVAAMAMVLAAAGRSAAGVITYTVTGSGTLDGKSFTDAPVTISGSADAAAIVNSGGSDPGTGFYTVFVTEAEVSVGGVGADAFTGSIFVFAAQFANEAGFVEEGVAKNTDILDLISTDIATYDLSAPALITSMALILPADNPAHGTTNGTFSLDSISTATVLTATAAVPEPSSLALCGIAGAIGLAGIGGRGLLRRRGGRGD